MSEPKWGDGGHRPARSRVLVIGGADAVGAQLVGELRRQGHEVVAADRGGRSADPFRAGGDVRTIDLRDPEASIAALDGVDAICHLGLRGDAQHVFAELRSVIADNDVGTATLLWAMDRIGFEGRIVLASSVGVYGEGARMCLEHGLVRAPERSPGQLSAGRFDPVCPACNRRLVSVELDEFDPLDPRTAVAASAVHQEQLVHAYVREHPAATATALRFHQVYGPGATGGLAAAIFLRQIEAGVRPQVFEDGGQLRDFVHVNDAARACLLALTVDDPFDGPLNVATGKPTSVLELATACCIARDTRLWPEITGIHRPSDVRHRTASPARAIAALGFRSELGLAEGIAEFVRSPS